MLIASRLGRNMSVAIAKHAIIELLLLADDHNCKSVCFRKKVLFRMASRKRTRSENRETKSQDSPMKNPPIVKVGLMSW